MGLGLTIARAVVIAHQGEIELKSEPGNGAEFTIYLPL
jgi:signal transduction histidine kinase